MWLITNKSISSIEKTSRKIVFGSYTFYENESSNEDSKLLNWFYEGHIFLRNQDDTNNCSSKSIDLLEDVYLKYKNDYINYIKGNFAVLHFKENSFKVYSDRFAIKKYFYWVKDNEFIISNDLNEIVKAVKVSVSSENMAIYALTYHFTGGRTLFNDVFHNQPAQVIEFKDSSLSFSYYWQPSQLLSLTKKDIEIKHISDSLSSAVSCGMDILSKDKISLSLTGGGDTRNLLAVFLKNGLTPHLYTYGNPQSADCIKSTAIAKGLGLEHSIYDIQMDEDTFERYARRIIRLGGGLASIHRVHRLMAVEYEKLYANWMFLGTLGGEFIKGVSEDNYIDPAIVFENWLTKDFSVNQLDAYLEEKFVRPKNIDRESLLSFIASEPYMNGPIITRKHNSLSYITAHLHDAQDINLYSTVMDDVFTPFLDIDYLEVVFSSHFTFDQKERIRNKYLKRIDYPVFASRFIAATYSPLLSYLYTGEHKPSEVVFNKYYAAVMRLFRQRNGIQYPANFPLGIWMERFVEKNLPLCNDHPAIKETFDIDRLLSSFKNSKHLPKESYWLKFTNPIMMRFIIEEFKL